jgi:hypothetical protein
MSVECPNCHFENPDHIMHAQQSPPPTQLNLILNWFDELKRLVPVGN